MSTKSSQKHVLIYNQNVYVNYFRHLAKKLGAIYVDVHQRLNFQTNLIADLPVGKHLVRIVVVLDWARKGTCWVLREMSMTPELPGLVSPSEDFLPFKAMRLAEESDLDNPSDEVYRIRSASDLAALFRTYDELAHDMGRTPLFGH